MPFRPFSQGISFVGCLLIPILAGCVAFAPTPEPELVCPPLPNPIFVRSTEPYVVWETVVDVIDNYFQIEFEEPVRVMDGLITEGRLDTYPRIGATILEPWRKDSVGRYERIHATLQSLRRRATVEVAPSAQGFRIQVAVFKELEDVPPGEGSGTPASFRNDTSLVRVTGPAGQPVREVGWIPIGRDFLLEQQILRELAARLGHFSPGIGSTSAATFSGQPSSLGQSPFSPPNS
jgi:hypothetical protein